MKGSVKNIGQKGNENRELYNNNLKVVNHMEKKPLVQNRRPCKISIWQRK